MHITVRTRRLLARHGWIRWTVVLVLAAGVGFATFQGLTALEDERSRWGTTVEVIVAASDLRPDGVFDVEIRAFPIALVPDDAISTLPDGARLRQFVGAGEVITDTDLSSRAGPAGLAEPGTAVIGIADPMVRSAAIGLDVRVAADGIVLAQDGKIVGVADEIVFVAVAEADAAMVAAASQIGSASLIFLP